MSDSDNDVGNVDNQPSPDSDSAAGAEPRRRTLRSWAARSEGDSAGTESVITRVRHSLASIFTPPDTSFRSIDEALPTGEVSPEFADTLPPETPIPAPVLELEDLRTSAAHDVDELQHAGDPSERTEPVIEATTAPMRFGVWWRLLEKYRFWKKKEAPAPEPAAATVVGGNPVFLFSKFRSFYNEVIRFRHQKTEFGAGFATAIMSEAAGSDPGVAAEALSKKLVELLELQAAEAKWMGGDMMRWYPEAQYAMAALADEIFTHTEWDGQSAWADHLLEARLYRTHGAAHEVFNRIDRLLKDAPNTPVSRDLARVYMLVLAAGFQGKYRPFNLPRAIAEYRQRLYEYIYREDPLMLYAPDRAIIPEVSARTLEGHAVTRFSSAQRWAAILAFVAIGYTIIAHVAWNRLSADLEDVTGRIVVDSAQTERDSP